MMYGPSLPSIDDFQATLPIHPHSEGSPGQRSTLHPMAVLVCRDPTPSD